jgi:hypothetical protein
MRWVINMSFIHRSSYLSFVFDFGKKSFSVLWADWMNEIEKFKRRMDS